MLALDRPPPRHQGKRTCSPYIQRLLYSFNICPAHQQILEIKAQKTVVYQRVRQSLLRTHVPLIVDLFKPTLYLLIVFSYLIVFQPRDERTDTWPQPTDRCHRTCKSIVHRSHHSYPSCTALPVSPWRLEPSCLPIGWPRPHTVQRRLSGRNP